MMDELIMEPIGRRREIPVRLTKTKTCIECGAIIPLWDHAPKCSMLPLKKRRS